MKTKTKREPVSKANKLGLRSEAKPELPKAHAFVSPFYGPVAHIPTRTVAQAKRLARVANMSDTALVEFATEAICRGILGEGGIASTGSLETWRAAGRSAIEALGLRGGRGGK